MAQATVEDMLHIAETWLTLNVELRKEHQALVMFKTIEGSVLHDFIAAVRTDPRFKDVEDVSLGTFMLVMDKLTTINKVDELRVAVETLRVEVQTRRVKQ